MAVIITKKHELQMTSEEQQYAKDLVKAIPTNQWRTVRHFIERLKERQVFLSIDRLNDVFENFRVVEYKEIKNTTTGNVEQRVLIREGKTCIVLSLTKRLFISCWERDLSDQNQTLDITEYNEELQIIK